MSQWQVEYLAAAAQDFLSLDTSQQLQVAKAIEKVRQNPWPVTEGGYGKPLRNKHGANLAGYLKIKLLKLGIRIVYKLMREKDCMRIIVISVRDDEKVYKLAQQRIHKLK